MTAAGFSFERLDRDGALAETAHEAGGVSRAGFFAGGLAGAAVLLGAVDAEDARAQKPGKDDIAILNFALTLEYLQAAFYTEAERLKELRGRTKRAAETVGAVERAHVKAFRDVLGRQAVKRPNFDFQGVTEKPDQFLKTAVAFEDLAVAAYKGQATRLKSREALAAAVSIHSVEARHAAWMRYLFGVDPAREAFDQPSNKQQVTKVVKSTNFIATTPSMKRKRAPRFTG
jgi:rubrerythrin